jgi:hypothetical protein
MVESEPMTISGREEDSFGWNTSGSNFEYMLSCIALKPVFE